MKTFILTLSGLEVLHLLRAELATTHSQPELSFACAKDYLVEEKFDRSAPPEKGHFYVKTSIATLTIEPRRESGYWILLVAVECALGLVRSFNDDEMAPVSQTLEEFETELRSARPKDITVRLDVQTPDIKRDFDRWLADIRAHHPVTQSL